MPTQFSQRLLNWFDEFGRKDLPWQKNKTGYRVWVSEIMLQQTQVVTVIPYFERFMQNFPTIDLLANASIDEVLHLWAGLGYYSRARNLHRAAKMVMQEYNGEFPQTIEALQQLPGIGQSTAGAIAAIAFNKHATILDGNVKRVLSRVYGVTDPVDDKTTELRLWDYAQSNTPAERVADYTQAIMDFGATFCTRSKPQCTSCPMQTDCIAHLQGLATTIPIKKASKKIPVKQASFLILMRDEEVLLLKRPPVGIWGGLWSLPEMPAKPDAKTLREFCANQFNFSIAQYEYLSPFRHTFSHYHLDIFPIKLLVDKLPTTKIMDADSQIWYKLAQPAAIGLPKPVQTLLKRLQHPQCELSIV